MNLDWTYFEKQFPLVTDSLKNARSAGRLAHAHLLCSTNPDYREMFPRLLSALAACENPKPDFSPCGVCETCREMLSGTHADTFTLAPSSASRIIPIGEDSSEPDTMRWFESLFYLSAMTKSRWKIGIVHEADRMNEQTQNAFLKTLEEPPEKCMFVLTTAHPFELLPTIKSRCQTIRLTDNACVYAFPGAERIPPVLSRLIFEAKNNLLIANDCASELVEFAGELKDSAKKIVAERWKQRLEDSIYLEKAGMSLIEKRIKGEEGCEYRKLREEFLSLIHAVFAQTALLSSGMEERALPNPELLAPPYDKAKAAQTPVRDACKMMNCAEDLLSAMRTNADDELALRAFCLKTAFLKD